MGGVVDQPVESYRDEVRRLRVRFQQVNTADPVSLAEWFQATTELTDHDRSVVAGVHLRTIEKWYKLAALPPRPGGKPPIVRRYRTPILTAPRDWDNPRWLEHAYRTTRSIRAIANAVGLGYRPIWERLHNLGFLAHRPPEPPHPCNNRTWLTEHYVRRRISQEGCAKLAGVSRGTFTRWLRRLQIQIRTGPESRSHRPPASRPAPLWMRRLKQDLEQQPIVRACRQVDGGLIVNFRTHVREVFWYGTKRTRRRAHLLGRADARLTTVPKIYEQYVEGFNPSQFPWHLLVDRAELDRCSLLECHLGLHTFVRRLQEQGWMAPLLPHSELTRDLARVATIDPATYVRGEGFRAAVGPTAAPGWALFLHFGGIDLSRTWASPRRLFHAAKLVLQRPRRQLCTAEVIRMACRLWGPKFYSPSLYLSLLRSLVNQGTVLDLHPGHGMRAVACAALGLRYLVPPAHRDLLEGGLADFVGLDWGVDDGAPVELVLADDAFGPTDLDAALVHAQRARRVVGFVPRDRLGPEADRLRPAKVVRIRTRLHRRAPDYLFIW